MRARHLVDDPRWHPREREACLLAESLRSARLSLLLGPPGSGKTSLLRGGLLPRLRRRAIDVDALRPAASGSVVPFPERRVGGDGLMARRPAELVIFFDAWQHDPLTALLAQMREAASLPWTSTAQDPGASLLQSLTALSRDRDARFLLIFDHFEDYLAAPPDRADIRDFAEQFIQAVNRPQQVAHFLLSLRDEAEPRLARFRARIAGFDWPELHLPQLRRVVEPPAVDFTATVYASIETMLSRVQRHEPLAPESARADTLPVLRATAASVDIDLPLPHQAVSSPQAELSHMPALEPAQCDTEPAAPACPPAAAPALPPQKTIVRQEAADLMVADPASMPAWDVSRRSQAAHKRRKQLLIQGVALLAGVGALWIVIRGPLFEPGVAPPGPPGGSASMLPARDVAVTSPALAALPRLQLMTATEGGGNARLTRELVHRIAPRAGIDLQTTAAGGWSGDLDARGGPARLAILRYDALQAARSAGASTPMRIVMPLYTEEIHALVRADAPLRFLHELQGRAINIGPAESSRALTATRLYERMFGSSLPLGDASLLDRDAALARLLDERGDLDAMILVGPQPLSELAGLVPQVASRLRLLRLQPDHPASRKALQLYLPATVPDAAPQASGTPTLAAMTFLVAATDEPQAADTIGRLAQALCLELPALRRDGDPKWREVQPALQLDAGWPVLAEAEAALRRCRDGVAAPPVPVPVRNP